MISIDHLTLDLLLSVAVMWSGLCISLWSIHDPFFHHPLSRILIACGFFSFVSVIHLVAHDTLNMSPAIFSIIGLLAVLYAIINYQRMLVQHVIKNPKIPTNKIQRFVCESALALSFCGVIFLIIRIVNQALG